MGAIAAIFYNKSEKRLRAGWRILIHLITVIAFVIGAGFVASLVPDGPVSEVVDSLVYLVAVLLATWLVGRFIDRRRFAAYGFHLNAGWWADLLFGLVLGAALMSGIVAVMLNLGWATLSQESATNLNVPIAAAFAIQVWTLIVVGINEEVVFRGYQLRNMSEGFSRFGKPLAIFIAIVISSAIFGLGHLGNESEAAGGAHTTSLAMLNLILAGGVMLAVPYLLTGELAIPIGIHITWNLFQGPVFGLAVSGLESKTRLLTVTPTGPEMWTGGDYGAEGGLLVTIAVFASIVLSALWVGFRKRQVALQTDVATYTPR